MKFKYLLACSLVCAVSASVNAAETNDWGELQPDVVYTYDAMVPVQGVFNPSESGVIRCYCTGDLISPYLEPTHDTPIQPTKYYYGADGVKVRIYEVTAGEPLYFYDFCPLDAGTFRIWTRLLSRRSSTPSSWAKSWRGPTGTGTRRPMTAGSGVWACPWIKSSRTTPGG